MACFLPRQHHLTGFQFSAISTLLDLVALVTSVGGSAHHAAGAAHSVTVKPLLTERQHSDLVQHTVVTQVRRGGADYRLWTGSRAWSAADGERCFGQT